ncbi:MAG: histidine--tRNA ligase [Candidatus Diapherotrites archaeon]
MAFQTVRGMRDFLPEQAKKKQAIEDLIRNCFEKYGFEPLQTPIVEEFSLLSAKGSGGEAVKEEIYYFKDKSERELGLRFDLTVPLARICASNPQLAKPFKRYSIGQVYRYDRPGASRYREFTQADVDIVGSDSMLAEAELIALMSEVLQKLGIEFFVKISSRKLLEEMVSSAGIPKEKAVDCFRSIDKLDKIGWGGVEKELKEKKINAGKLVEVLKQNDLKKVEGFLKNKKPIEELNELIALLKKIGLEKEVRLDLCLARGLEYYTGTVFEAVAKNGPSIAGGGRYDKLVELYGGRPSPAVGFSFGVDRLLDLAQEKVKPEQRTRIFIAAIGEKAEVEALALAQKIRAIGIGAEIDLMRRSVSKNLEYLNKKGIPFAVVLGENELKEKAFKLKEMKSGKETRLKFGEVEKLRQLV